MQRVFRARFEVNATSIRPLKFAQGMGAALTWPVNPSVNFVVGVALPCWATLFKIAEPLPMPMLEQLGVTVSINL